MTTTFLLKQFGQRGLSWWPRRGGSSQRQALRQAIRRAYATFAQKHWSWIDYLFDEAFLTGRAFPLLARYLDDQSLPQATDLVILWATQISWFSEETRHQHMAELAPVAADFLRLLALEWQVTARG